jgi:fibronectin-binding autotransporter adhesin
VKRFAIAALTAVAVAVGAAHAAGADSTLCVGGPHCYPTLAAALAAAGDGDTIRLNPGDYAGGVTVTHSVRLLGSGARVTSISGGGPVVTIGSPTSAPTVTIANLTIRNGLTTTNPHAPSCGLDVPVCGPGYADATATGGGIETFAGTTVTLLFTVVTGNRATPALTTASVKATCANGPCPAAFGDGGGIDLWGTMTLIGSTVSDNHASAPAQSNGGGVAVHSGASLTLRGSQVTGNSAAATAPAGRFVSGGGIFVNGDATLTVDSTSIDHNASLLSSSLASPYPIQDGGSDASNSIGGGLFLSDGSTATIRNSALSGNAVSVDTPLNQSFGADAALCACGGVSLTMQNTRVEGNTLSVTALATDNGPSGPIAFEADGDGTSITSTRFDGNTGVVTTSGDSASLFGTVGFFSPGNVANTVTSSSISNNSATANAPNGDASVFGAGVFNNGPLVVAGSTIGGNRGRAAGKTGLAQGGGIWNGQFFGGSTSPLSLQGSRVVANALSGTPGVTLAGGGIYTVGFPTTLLGTLVAGNTPDQCEGC